MKLPRPIPDDASTTELRQEIRRLEDVLRWVKDNTTDPRIRDIVRNSLEG